MKIEQSFVYDDEKLKALARLCLVMKWPRVARIVLTALGVFYLAFGIVGIIFSYSFSAVLFALGVLFMLLAHLYIPLSVRRGTKKANAQFLGKQVEYVIDESGIHVSSEFGASVYEWKFLDRIIEVDDYLGLQLKNRSTLIVRKDLLSDAELEWLKGKKTK